MLYKKKRISRAAALVLSAALGLSCFAGLPAVAAGPAADSTAAAVSRVTGGEEAVVKTSKDAWTLENQSVRLSLSYQDGSLRMTSFYNKAAGREYLSADDQTNYLFSYDWAEYQNGAGPVAATRQTVASNDGNWTVKETPAVEEISTRDYALDTLKLGKALSIVLENSKAGMRVTLRFEIYNGPAGIRYQTFVKNIGSKKMVIPASDVLSLNFPDEGHYLHYINARTSSSGGAENATWKTTDQNLNFQNASGKRNGRNALCVYGSGDGWWIMPETNWRTQVGPETYGDTSGGTNTTPEFASVSCWDDDSSEQVMVRTHPESVQLTLKPDEEYPYIGVNLTAFKGDVVDGKMAAEEHFRLRFKYHDTTTILNTNDWDYNSKSTFEYMRDVIIPQAVKANVDMVMIDDLWNVDRDSITAVPKFKSLSELGQMIRDNGKMFGIWYSLTGGGHNSGRDLADPDEWYGSAAKGVTGKKELIETLINDYKMDHQMIDLTEFWQNTKETDYSSPCDNVYRKNVNVNNGLNELVAAYPNYLVKLTNEVDVYPTQGNRACGLLHMADNGWVVHNAGLDGGMKAASNAFGYLPLNSVYSGGPVEGSMAVYYHYMFARNVKLNTDPGGPTWTDHGVELMATFNNWRKGSRIKELTDNQVTRPTYMGKGWDQNDGEKWISEGVAGPYAWMYTAADRSRALMLATSYTSGAATRFTADTRWLDETKNYLVADVTLDDTGSFTYAYKGLYTGKDLTEKGFAVDLTENTSGGKAFWFEAVGEDDMQVVYADEKIEKYETTVKNNVMTLSVEGTPGETGVIIVADAASDKGRVLSIRLDDKGEASLEIPADKLYDPEGPVVNLGKPVRYEFEDWYKTGEIQSSDGVKVAENPSDDSGRVGASGSDYRSVSFKKAGDWVGGPVQIPAPGKYKVTAAFKSHNNTGKSAVGLDGAPIGDTVDMSDPSAYTPNNIYTQSAEIDFKEAGEQILQIFCMGKGMKNDTNAGLSLRIDYVELTPVYSEDAGIVEAEAADMTATGEARLRTIDDPTASGGKLTEVSGAGGGAAVALPFTVESTGAYNLTLQYRTGPEAPKLRITDGEGTLDRTLNAYSKTASIATADLGELTFTEAGVKTLSITVAGHDKENRADSYTFGLDSLQIVSSPGVEAERPGTVCTVGGALDLSDFISPSHMQQAYMTAASLRWQIRSETAFDVAEVDESGRLRAHNPGTAVLRVSNQFAPAAYLDFVVTVLDDSASDSLQAAAAAIAELGTPVRTDAFAEKLMAAETLLSGLTAADQKLATGAYLLKAARYTYDQLSSGTASAARATYYLEDLAYTGQGALTKGTCPSGSHKIQFAEDGEIYEHGMGFEPPDGYNGSLLVPVPANTDVFRARVGVDYAMSRNNQYDQQNQLTFYLDGKQAAQTGVLKSNFVDGKWVDTYVYDIEIPIPAGSKWLYIKNFIGRDRNCDHILLADARFENQAAAHVEALIVDIAPENVNLDHWSSETADKIREAETAYRALSALERSMVSNRNVLVSHRQTHAGFGKLTLNAADLVKVEAVADAIAAVQTEGKRGVSTLALAEAAADALKNLEYELTDYLPDLFRLYDAQWWIEENRAGLTAAQPVYDQIAALPDEVAEADRPAVEAARAAYAGLTPARQMLVDNVSRLLAAEAQLNIVKGDLTGDGKVNISDVMAACKVLARKSMNQDPTEDEIARGDMNGDGYITITDVMALCKVLASRA